MGQISPLVADGVEVAEIEEPCQAALEAVRRRRATNTRRKLRPNEWTVCDADTKIPKLGAIYLAFPAPSISPPAFTRCRSFRTRSTWRCSTRLCTTSESFPPTTAGIRATTGRGTVTHAATGKATRSSSCLLY